MYAFQDNTDDETDWIKRFVESNLVDGICLLRVEENDKCVKYLRKIDFPFVVIGRNEDTEDLLWVDNDNYKAAYDLVNLLIKKGNNKIGYVGAEANLNVSIDRLRGYKDALKDKKLSIDKNIIYKGANFSMEEGERAAGKKNISVVGFNNVYLSAYRETPLASVDINAERLGYYAIKILVEYLVSGRTVKSNQIIDVKLIERESLKR